MIEKNILYNKNGGKDSIFDEKNKSFVYFLHIVFFRCSEGSFYSTLRRSFFNFRMFICRSYWAG